MSLHWRLQIGSGRSIRAGQRSALKSRARASAISKYTKNNQHWVSISVRPFALSSFAVAAHDELLSLPGLELATREPPHIAHQGAGEEKRARRTLRLSAA